MFRLAAGALKNGAVMGTAVLAAAGGGAWAAHKHAGGAPALYAESLARGGVFACGFGLHGQLGQGELRSELFPVPVKKLARKEVVQVEGGGHMTVVRTSNGKLYSFGSGARGVHGHADESNQNIPRQVRGVPAVSDVAVGAGHMAAVGNDGKLYAWGDNRQGQLGVGKASKQEKVVSVQALDGVVRVSCGKSHTCAITSDGKLFCWGHNFSGELGIGDDSGRDAKPAPVQVAGALADKKVVDVACGREHSAAVTADGAVFTWGSDENGQCGKGGAQRYYRTPQMVDGLASEHVVAVKAGDYHTALVTKSGVAYTFGAGREGQLGHGDKSDLLLPTAVEELEDEGEKVVAVELGGAHSAFVTESGALYMAGKGRDGQLGNGGAGYSLVPVKVAKFSRAECLDVACGNDHTVVVVRGEVDDNVHEDDPSEY